MKHPRLSLLNLALPLTLGAIVAGSASVLAQDRIIVRPRRLELVRNGEIARDFPERKRAIVRYPIVGGLSDAAVLRRIQNTLAIKNVFDFSLEDHRRDGWLTEFDYKVNYNKNYLLDITFSQSGVVAYPDSQTRNFLINLKSGRVIKAADAFNSDSLATLAAMTNQKFEAEAREIIKEVQADKDSSADQKDWIKNQSEQLKFEPKNLDGFSAGDKGVTFLYEAGFPHVIQALEPDGRYFFSYLSFAPTSNAMDRSAFSTSIEKVK